MARKTVRPRTPSLGGLSKDVIASLKIVHGLMMTGSNEPDMEIKKRAADEALLKIVESFHSKKS